MCYRWKLQSPYIVTGNDGGMATIRGGHAGEKTHYHAYHNMYSEYLMQFKFQNPTQIIFGAGSLSRLGAAVAKHGSNAMVVTGGGSVKKNGTFDRAIESLKAAGVSTVECDGVEPNPRLSTVLRGAQIAKDAHCDVVIALGGGSAMDAAKAMAAMVFYEEEPWHMFFSTEGTYIPPTKALPVITVPTLAATGSEMNSGAVVTNEETKENPL